MKTKINCKNLPVTKVNRSRFLRKMYLSNEETFYMRGKLKELRESRHMTQTGMGSRIGVSQQNISKYEQDACSMPVDMLIRIAEYFNVTTDYLLGRSEVKRSFAEEAKVGQNLDEYYDLIEVFKELDKRDQEIVWATIEMMARTRK